MVNCRFCGNEIDPSGMYCGHCGKQQRSISTTKPTRPPWLFASIVIIVGILLIATIGFWPKLSGNDGNDSNDNDVLPNSKVLLNLWNEYYQSGNGEGFGCRELGTSGLGCKLETVYEDFKISWSADNPVNLEIGTNEDSRKWFCMGYGCDTPKSSGSTYVGADWSIYGNVWFHWGDNDPLGDGTTIYELKITAYLS